MGACASVKKRKRRLSNTSTDDQPPEREPKWFGSTGADRIKLNNCGMMMSLGQTRIASVDYEFLHPDGSIDSKVPEERPVRRRRFRPLRKSTKPKSWLLVVVEFGPLETLHRASVAFEQKKVKFDMAEVEISEDETEDEPENRGNKIGIVIKFHELYDYDSFRLFPQRHKMKTRAHMQMLMETIDDWVGKYIVFSTVHIKNNRIWVMVIGSFHQNSFETYFFKGADVYTWSYKISAML